MTITTGYNIVLAIGGLNGFDWTFMQGSTFVLRLNFSAKNPRPSPIRGSLTVILDMDFGSSCRKYCYANSIGKLYEYYDGTEFIEFTVEDMQIMKYKNILFDGTKGGLVLGKLHKEGGIHLLIPTTNGRYRYVAEMEGWEYLSPPILEEKNLNAYRLINDEFKNAECLIETNFAIPSQCNIIDTKESEIAFILITGYTHFVINRLSTRKFIDQIINLNNS